MSAEQAKRALDACEKGVNEMIAISQSNQEKLNYYNNTEKPEYNTKWDAWKGKRDQRGREQQDWENRKNEIFERKGGERKQTGEGINPQSGWCKNDHGDDWEAVERLVNWANVGGMNCKKTESARWREATNEAGRRPDNFNETEPQKPPEPAQNKSNISISCCANITQIIASQVNDSTINHANDCMSNLKQGYNDAVRKEEEEQKRKEEEEKKRKEEEEKQRKLGIMQKAGVGGFIIICSCLFLFIIISLIFGLGGSNEDTDMEYAESTYSVPTSVPTPVQTFAPPPPPYSESENSGFLGGLF